MTSAIRRLREDAGLTQVQLAEVLHVSAEAVMGLPEQPL